MDAWRRAAWGAVAAVAASAGGCLGPQALKTPAQQNQANITTYNANVGQLMAALRRQAQVQGDLQVQVARESFSPLLVGLRKDWLGSPTPTRSDLSDPTQPPHSTVAAQVRDAGKLARNSADDRLLIEQKYPLVADIVLETRHADTTEVVLDAFELTDLNSRISGETDPAIRAILMAKRNGVLDRYPPVRRELETVRTYLEALDQVLAEVQGQGALAAVHAQTFMTVSQTAPAIESLTGAFKDQDLRARVLDIVKTRHGEGAATRVSGFLADADEAIGVIDGLTHK